MNNLPTRPGAHAAGPLLADRYGHLGADVVRRVEREILESGPYTTDQLDGIAQVIAADVAVDPDHDSGSDCTCPACEDKPRCRYCVSDYEGCECTEADALGRDAGR